LPQLLFVLEYVWGRTIKVAPTASRIQNAA